MMLVYMKKLIVSIVASLFLLPAAISAQEKTVKTATVEKDDWEQAEKIGRRDEFSLKEKARFSGAPVDRARPGVIASWILDISGLGLNIAGWLFATDSLVLFAEVWTGNALMVAGSIVGTQSLHLRNKSYRETGFRPAKGFGYAAWSMTALAIVSWGASFLFFLDGGVYAFAAATPVIETVNAVFVRPFWNRALMKSARKTLTFSPLVSIAKEPLSEKSMPIFGIKGVL